MNRQRGPTSNQKLAGPEERVCGRQEATREEPGVARRGEYGLQALVNYWTLVKPENRDLERPR